MSYYFWLGREAEEDNQSEYTAKLLAEYVWTQRATIDLSEHYGHDD